MNTNHVDCFLHTKNTNFDWPSPPMNPLMNADVDPIIDILTDADLEKELSLYANAHFTFDTPPLMGMAQKKSIPLGAYPHHLPSQRHPNPPLTLDIPLAITTNDACFKDQNSSTVLSPYDYQKRHQKHRHQQQHYFTPLPSLPGSPTHEDSGQSQLLSFMMLSPTEPPLHPPTVSTVASPPFQENYPTYETDPTPMHRSVSAHNGWPEPSIRKRQRTQSTPAQQTRMPSVDLNPIETIPYKEEEDDDEEEEVVTADMIRLDKRRRNTAASARFRIKKKMREQTLQRTACEMTEKARFFENKVHELEREIKWLKDLLVAKNGFPC